MLPSKKDFLKYEALKEELMSKLFDANYVESRTGLTYQQQEAIREFYPELCDLQYSEQ